MIKIFFENRVLLFNEKVSPELQFAKVLYLNDKTESEIKLFLSAPNYDNLEILNASAEDAMSIMSKCTRIIPAAGGRVHDKSGKILFINRFEHWDFPKGWCEKGETIAECAVREVCEECGIKSDEIIISDLLLKTYHIYHLDNNFALKETSWFKMLYLGNGELKPQTEEGISEVYWATNSEIEEIKKQTYENIKLVLEK